MRDVRVLGVDACKAGWLGVIATGEHMRACFASTLDDLVAAADKDGPVALIALDMPIGLPDHEHREADVLARNAVGRLRNSVFITPVRAAFAAPDHATASARNREMTGSGITIQAFSLQPKVLEVDAWIHRTRRWVVEIHPESASPPWPALLSTLGRRPGQVPNAAESYWPPPASFLRVTSVKPAAWPRSMTSWMPPSRPGRRSRFSAAWHNHTPTHPRSSVTACPARSGTDGRTGSATPSRHRATRGMRVRSVSGASVFRTKC